MKTDPIFYRLFQNIPSAFFEIIGRSPDEALAYEFRSVEIKQTAFRIDGVFIPVADDERSPILFTEVQFQRDDDFYFRFFSEITLYLRQYKPLSDWQAFIIYPRRSVESSVPLAYQDWVALSKIQRLYLNELTIATSEAPLGISLAKLLVESKARAPELARTLISRAQKETGNSKVQREIIELVETIIIYKFPKINRQELETMLGLGALKETKFYQEAAYETKIEAVPRLLKLGLSIEQVAEALELSLEDVQRATQR